MRLNVIVNIKWKEKNWGREGFKRQGLGRKWTENKAIGMGSGLVQGCRQDELKWSHEWQSQFDRGNANGVLAKGSGGVGVDNSPRL